MKRRLKLYARFERFWHWTQAVLVLSLVVTGLEIHGTIALLGFQRAVRVHEKLAWLLIVLVVFAIFWHFTTGAWRQYVPTRHNVRAMVRFYLQGIFQGEPHPTKKTELLKLNPLQRLTYFALKVFVFPVQIGSGLLYLLYDQLPAFGVDWRLGTIAFVHTAATYALVAFVLLHVYLTTTGETPTANLQAMITGWDVVEEDDEPAGTRAERTQPAERA